MDQLKPLHILLVDDDDVDVMVVRRTFAKARIGNPMIVKRDGEAALTALRCGEIPEPRIILLDLNMPRMTGIEFLEELRKDSDLKDERVFVLSTSNAEEDKAAALALGASDYLVKDRINDELVDLVTMLNPFWTLVASHPDD